MLGWPWVTNSYKERYFNILRILVEVCHHNDVVRLEQISLREPVGQGRYQELGDILLLRVQISRLKKKSWESGETCVLEVAQTEFLREKWTWRASRSIWDWGKILWMSLHRTMPDFSRKFRSSNSGLLEDLDDFLLEEFFSLSSSSITLEIKNGCQNSVTPLYSFSPSISRLEPRPPYPGHYSLKISADS